MWSVTVQMLHQGQDYKSFGVYELLWGPAFLITVATAVKFSSLKLRLFSEFLPFPAVLKQRRIKRFLM